MDYTVKSIIGSKSKLVTRVWFVRRGSRLLWVWR